jgi:phosphopantothenoylcysteine decarboxylase/phosphopantothenate--cysteine ligase
MKVLLGITGGIAAYKAAEIIRLLTESGNEVRVVPTENALRFIGATTLEALSHNVVDAGLYTDIESVKHIELGQWADVVLVAPATASFLARTAAGIADDLLGNVMLATNARIVVAPAMHTEMWQNQATVNNVAVLRARGITVIEPDSGRLTGADTGVGRLPEPASIVAAIGEGLSLSGKRIVVTAGGTREPIDPVRFIGNYSSGKQGLAIANEARALGAEVTLIACNLGTVPSGYNVVRVETTLELESAVQSAVVGADALIMCAAVADYRVANKSESKIKKAGADFSLHLVENPDILASVEVDGLLKVGFAAETSSDLEALALHKLDSKRAQVIVANDVSGSAVFGSDKNSVVIVQDSGATESVTGSKSDVARSLLATIAQRLA